MGTPSNNPRPQSRERVQPSSGELYRLGNASIKGPNGLLLEGLTWSIPRHAISVLLGPAGTGKSHLLRALSGRGLGSGWRLQGTWLYGKEDLCAARTRFPFEKEIAWVPQKTTGMLTTSASAWSGSNRHTTNRVMSWREALEAGLPVVLLDEPTRGLSNAEGRALTHALLQHRANGSAIVVTHDLAFARQIADEVFMVCAGKMVAQSKAQDFFRHPPSELAARFIQQGNCWPSPPAPPLPRHFHWIIPNQLAGMGRPGLLEDTEQELEAIAQAGITLLVSLTEKPFPADQLRPFGITGRHFPIVDMKVPALGSTAALCRDLGRAIANGDSVALHCNAGLGRTGTLLASYLVWCGEEPDSAIARIRKIGRGYIQNQSQYQFVHRFSEMIGVGRKNP